MNQIININNIETIKLLMITRAIFPFNKIIFNLYQCISINHQII